MKTQITKFQHYVPQHYLKLWSVSPGSKDVYLHDLGALDASAEALSTKRILGREFYYEKDPGAPDNLIENRLGAIENAAAPVLKKIDGLSIGPNQQHNCFGAAKVLADTVNYKTFIEFVSSQLVRTPRIIEQVTKSINISELARGQREALLDQTRPDAFIELGMERLPTRLQEYSIILLNTEADPFVTSDHPVAELCTDPNVLAQPVFNVLHKQDTILFMPISPRFACIFIPPENQIPAVRQIRTAARFWDDVDGVKGKFGWRDTGGKQMLIYRQLYTGFGRSWLVSCRDESELIATSPLLIRNKPNA